MKESKEELTIVHFNLNGLSKEGYRADKKAGDVAYSKRNRYFEITVPYISPLSGEMTTRAGWISSVKVEHDLNVALKKAARPFTTINTKVDNARPKLSNIMISVNSNSGEIVSFTENGRDYEQEAQERISILEENPTYALFCQFPSLGNKQD